MYTRALYWPRSLPTQLALVARILLWVPGHNNVPGMTPYWDHPTDVMRHLF